MNIPMAKVCCLRKICGGKNSAERIKKPLQLSFIGLYVNVQAAGHKRTFNHCLEAKNTLIVIYYILSHLQTTANTKVRLSMRAKAAKGKERTIQQDCNSVSRVNRQAYNTFVPLPKCNLQEWCLQVPSLLEIPYTHESNEEV